MSPFNSFLDRFGRWIARQLETETPSEAPYIPTDRHALRRTLREGDVLLVAGSSTLSTAIKYLTQSTWSHAALYVGDALAGPDSGDDPPALIEADMIEGVWVNLDPVLQLPDLMAPCVDKRRLC